MDNYAVMMEGAKRLFCTYDMDKLARKNGVRATNTHLITTFFGKTVEIEKATGNMTVDEKMADFGECLTVFDWLCDRKEYAVASGQFCPVSSLPGVLSSGGGGLVMNTDALAAKIHRDPDAFREKCVRLGGREVPMGDLGFELDAFPDLPVRLKFYFADDEFPASLTFLWDQNILQFVRYETVYYLAGCLRSYLYAENT